MKRLLLAVTLILAGLVSTQAQYVVPYADAIPSPGRTYSDALNDYSVSALNFIPKTLHAAIRAGTSTTDVSSYLADMHAAVPIYVPFKLPPGQYNIGAGATAMAGRVIDITGVTFTGGGSITGALSAGSVNAVQVVMTSGSTSVCVKPDGSLLTTCTGSLTGGLNEAMTYAAANGFNVKLVNGATAAGVFLNLGATVNVPSALNFYVDTTDVLLNWAGPAGDRMIVIDSQINSAHRFGQVVYSGTNVAVDLAPTTAIDAPPVTTISDTEIWINGITCSNTAAVGLRFNAASGSITRDKITQIQIGGCGTNVQTVNGSSTAYNDVHIIASQGAADYHLDIGTSASNNEWRIYVACESVVGTHGVRTSETKGKYHVTATDCPASQDVIWSAAANSNTLYANGLTAGITDNSTSTNPDGSKTNIVISADVNLLDFYIAGTGLSLNSGRTLSIVAPIGPALGGTGVINDAAATVTSSGNYAYTRTLTAATNVTFPTTGTLATLAGSEELTNKTLNASVGKGTWTASGTWTLPAFTLGGTVSGGGNNINNVIIGAVTPLAGSFTTVTLTSTPLALPSGGIINWNSGAVTLTQGTGLLNQSASVASGRTVLQLTNTSTSGFHTAQSFWSSNSDSNERNWAFEPSIAALGDFAWLQSNAAGGNPTTLASSTIAMYISAARGLTINGGSTDAGAGGLLAAGTIKTTATTDATSTSTGALQIVGGASINKRVFMNGLTTSSSTQTAYICQSSGGELIADSVACLVSNPEYKEDFGKISDAEALTKVTNMPIGSWRYKREAGSVFASSYYRERIGFLATDLAHIDERLVAFDQNGKPRSDDYNAVVTLQAGAIRALKADNDNLRRDFEQFKKRASR